MDGKRVFRSLAILLKNDESQYDALRQETVIHICDNWYNFTECVILTRVGYKSMMGQDGLYVGACRNRSAFISDAFGSNIRLPYIR
jgi:hypothetical protein